MNRVVALTLGLCACGAPRPPLGPSDGGPEDAGVRDLGPTEVDAGVAPDGGGLSLGLLQFRLRHNLVDEGCLSRGDCALTIEAPPSELPAWLADLEAASTQAVLHYDRALPWAAFSVEAPGDQDLVAFYDRRLDAELLAYLSAFERHFAEREARYLAVSILDGTRDRLASMRALDGTTVVAPERCTTLTATTTLDFGGGPIEIRSAYRRFLQYLVKKLQPTRLALLVEINLYRALCPRAWPGMVELYHHLYQVFRAELPATTSIFATLTLADLLGYRGDRCNPPNFGLCTGPLPPAPVLNEASCYPLDRGAIDDLDRGDHLDLLALSFYPDGLGMAPPGVPEARLLAFPPESDGQGTCYAQAGRSALLDPLLAIERLGWNKPVAIAEWSARSCSTYAWWATPEQTFLVRFEGHTAEQAYWMERILGLARAGRFSFVNYSFLVDYPPIGPWMPRLGAMDGLLYTLFNGWACSGLRDEDGAQKPELGAWWRPSL